MKKVKFKNQTFTFKKWSRKAFAVKNSLNKVVKIGVLTAAYCSTFSGSKVNAQNDESIINLYDTIDEVTISEEAVLKAEIVDQQIIDIITKQELESSPASSIDKLIELAVGIDIRQRGSNNTQADISLRSGSFDQLLVMINGINVTDPQTGHYSLNIPVSIDEILRIEVIKPSESKLYGQNGFSGAINIITKDTHKSSIKANFEYGTFNSEKYSAGIKIADKNSGHSLSFSNSKSDGYITNTDYKINNAFYHGNFKQKNTKIKLQAGISNKNYGANSFYTPKYKLQRDNTQTIFSGIQMSTGNSIKIKPKVYWRRNYDHYILDSEHPEWYQNYHLTDVLGSNISATFKSLFNMPQVIGVDYRYESILSNILGTEMNNPVDIPGADSNYHKSFNSDLFSLFTNYNIHYNNWIVEVYLSENWNSRNKRFEFFPALGLSYNFQNGLKVFSNYDKSMRLPTLTDLFYESTTNKGNPELEPEYSTLIDFGVKYSNKWLFLNNTVYYRKGENIIDWMKESEADIWETKNITTLHSYGYETGLRADFSKIYKSIFIKSLNINYSYNETNKKEENYISHYALDNLRNSLNLSIESRIIENIYFTWSSSYRDRNGTFMKYNSENDTETKSKYPDYWISNIKLSRKGNYSTIYLNISNIFDQKYYDIGNIIQPGRWINGGIKLTLKTFKK